MIEVHCTCGKAFRVPDAKAGARGKCPGCGKPIVVPRGTDKRSLPVPPHDTSPCPICKSTYAPGIVICFICGIDLRTGRPLPPPEDDDIPVAELNDDPNGLPLALDPPMAPTGREQPVALSAEPPLEITRSADGVLQLNFDVAPAPSPFSDPAVPTDTFPTDVPPLEPEVPRGRARQKERRPGPIITAPQEGPKGFARIVFDTYIHPISTMDSLTFYLSSWPMLAKMAIFYVGSLLVIFLNAWLNPEVALGGGKSRSETTMGTLSLGGEPFKETERYTGDFVLNIWVEPTYPEVGKRTRIATQIDDNLQGKAMKGKVTADIFYEGWEDPKRTKNPDEVGRALPFLKGSKEDDFYLDYDFKDGGGYKVILHITPEPPADPKIEAARKPADYGYGFVVKGYARSQGPTLQAFMVALLTAFSSVVGLLITAVCVNISGRLIGSGGSFVAMLVVLAFLTGVVNYTMTVMLVLTPSLGPGAAPIAGFAFLIWRTGLFLLALMKVYDVDFMFACAIAFFSNQIQVWTAFWILGALYKLAT